VRFDPWTARFSGKGVDFTWSELMFRPELCLQRLQREVEAELASFTPALLAKAFRGEL
jgi:hypothetical protein